jgi:hypothetical protein
MRNGRADKPCEVTQVSKGRRKATTPPTVELIVRRGALRRFDKLKRATESLDLPVKLSWDRRLGERRTSSSDVRRERRGSDRRKEPPFTWGTADFIVIEREPPAPVPRVRAKSKRR